MAVKMVMNMVVREEDEKTGWGSNKGLTYQNG